VSDAAAAPVEPTRSSGPLALVIAIAMGVTLLLVVITLAFSTSNTPASIDGTTATTSQFID
jgi:hypothetical protein